MAKISFVTTVLNEENSIESLLDSLEAQTKKPDEVIIVDGGSDDKTMAIINRYLKKGKLVYRLIKSPGNRAKGRNVGVAAAKFLIIAFSDAGCQLDKDWLKRLTKSFSNKRLDAVAGYYLPVTNTLWQKCFAPFMAVMPDKLNPDTFLPSSRSLAVRRRVVLKLNGYPEQFDYCEDLFFARRLKNKTNMGVATNAIVHWRLPETLEQFFNALKNYARGDRQALYWPHLIRIATVFARYFVFVLMPLLFPLYLLIYPNYKHWHYVKNPLGLIYLPITQLAADLAVMSGVII